MRPRNTLRKNKSISMSRAIFQLRFEEREVILETVEKQ